MQSSGTGTHCVNTYAKFVSGQSFINTDLEKQKFGTQTGGELRRKLGFDFACFQGFAIHVAYNALLEAVEFNYVPFENCRLGAEKKDSNNFVFCVSWKCTKQRRCCKSYRNSQTKNSLDLHFSP